MMAKEMFVVAEGELETPVRVKVSTGFTPSASVCDIRQVDGLSYSVDQPFIRSCLDVGTTSWS